MKRTVSKIVLMLLIFPCSNISTGQNEKSNDSSYLLTSMNFISDAVFMGRKDSISNPYIYPTITYHHKSGFYTTGSLSYLTRADEGRIDLFLLTAGYDFTANKLDGDVSVTKYVFNDDSYNVISEVEADITAQFIYDFDIVNFGLAASLYLNSDSNSDFFLSSEISYDFVSNNERFQISPNAGIHFGSQNFYEQYYRNNRFGNGRGRQQGQANGSSESAMVNFAESEKFNLMAVEFSLPIWYVSEPWLFSFLPAFLLAQNPATLIADGIIFEEDLENTFYWIVGVAYSF